jgi:pimeloyl-ACP methyl ester carboxylesterase
MTSTAANRTRRNRRRLAAVAAAVLALGLAACGQDTPESTAAAAPDAPTPSTVVRPTQARDGTVRTEHGSMRLRCVGSGPTTVLLIAGWGGAGDGWGAIEPDLTERARVCSYDRFGTGTSDPPPSTQTFATQAADLRALLDSAGEPGPYVVLGHSFGGATAVTFAAQQPADVRGLLLLDASPVTWPAAMCAVADDGTEAAASYQALCAVMKDPTQDPERLNVFAAFTAVEAIDSLGDLPMAVVTAARRTAPDLADAEVARLDAVWDAGVQRWAALSSDSKVVTVEDTSHYIHLDHPRLVVDELLALLPPAS